MTEQRQIFTVSYNIFYNSGANYKGTRDVIAISESGAIDIIKWLFKVRNITIISVIPTFKYIGAPIIPDYEVLGDY
jgi:hypothetical protein